MSQFTVKTDSIRGTASQITANCAALKTIDRSVANISANLALKAESSYNIKKQLSFLHDRFLDEAAKMDSLSDALNHIADYYEAAERKLCGISLTNNTETQKDIFDNISYGKPYFLPNLLFLISPFTSLPLITGGIFFGGFPSLFDSDRTPSSSASADWLGYEFDDNHPGVTAWGGKANASAQNEWAYAGVNAYLGKASAEAEAGANLMKSEIKKEYKDGEWEEKQSTSYVNVMVSASASASILAADVSGGLGNNMLGAEGSAEASIGNASAEAKGKLSIGDEGVNLYAKAKALVSAIEGKAKGTLNILGLEITTKASGYAGALGVEGKIGIEDSKFVLKAGAAALIGGSVEIAVGLNEDGWDNFVDFITFWD